MPPKTKAAPKDQKLEAIFYSVRAVVAVHYCLFQSVTLGALNLLTPKSTNELRHALEIMLAPLAYEEWCEQCHFQLSEKEEQDCKKLCEELAARSETTPQQEYERAFQAVKKLIDDKK